MPEQKRAGSASSALLLIDFQQDFLSEQGRMPVARHQAEPVVAAARQALVQAKANDQIIVAIGNEFRPTDWLMNVLRRRAAVSGSPGTQCDDRLPLDGAIYIPKWASSAFSNPDLLQLLRKLHVGRLDLTGLFARACVSATAKDALRNGFEVRVLENAVACASDRSRAAALRRLRRAGAEVATALQ